MIKYISKVTCIEKIISLFQNELPVCLPIFLERLRNEITRLTTVKALTKVASSPLRIDLSPILVNIASFRAEILSLPTAIQCLFE